MVLINSSLSIPDVTGIFLRRASAVSSALVLFDKSEVGFISSSPGENYCCLLGADKIPTGSFRYGIVGFTMVFQEGLREPPV